MTVLVLSSIISIASAQGTVIQGRVEGTTKINNEMLIKLNIININGYALNHKPGDTIVVSFSPYKSIGECVEVRGSFDPGTYGGNWIDFFADSVETITCPSEPKPPQCTPGPIGYPQCYGNAVQQLYQDSSCNQYWQVIDDCNRYIPSKCCQGSSCVSCGGQEKYRCVNNVVERLVITNGIEEWQVFDDCNKYNPPKQCIGGICVKGDEPEPQDNCIQTKCQEQNGPIGGPYTKDGKTYQRYHECDCVGIECQCQTLEKEVTKKEIKFTGTAIEFHKGEMPGAPSYWIVKIDDPIISGPQPCSDELKVTTYQAINDAWGFNDTNICEGDQVAVYGVYLETNSGCEVTLQGSEEYYIKLTDNFVDDFKKLELIKWQVSTWCNHKDPNSIENDCPFLNGWAADHVLPSTDNNANSVLDFFIDGRVYKANSQCPEDRSFTSGEISTKRQFGYGRYECRLKAAKGSGVVTTFFIYDQASKGEIDIEIFGKDKTDLMQVNTWTVAAGVRVQHPHLVTLGFDASADYHNYCIDWSKDAVVWSVDGQTVCWSENGQQVCKSYDVPNPPGNIFLSLWPSNSAIWSDPGTFNLGNGQQIHGMYDWVMYITDASI